MKFKFKAITLVETLITLLAISFMIAGPIFFVSRSFGYAKYVQQKVAATSLAQEGIELATSLRNNSTTTFTSLVDANCLSATCTIDWNGSSDAPNISPCDENTNSCQLNLVASGAGGTLRVSGAGEASGYLRALYIEKNDTIKSYTITSRVWSKEDATFVVDVKLKKILYAN